jgi:hypothetical protein
MIEKWTNINFIPYYINQSNTKIYYNNKTYMTFTEVGVQSVGEENSNWVEINALTIEQKVDVFVTKVLWSTILKPYIPKFLQKIEVQKIKYATTTNQYKYLQYFQQKLVFVDYQYTSNVDDGYIWWTYFKVTEPSIVKEAWLEYYNNSQYTKQWFTWLRQAIPNEIGGEYAWFILPQTKYTNVRGYVILNNDTKILTSTEGDIHYCPVKL